VWNTLPILLASASTVARGIDLLFWAVTLVTVVFSALIAIAIIYFAVKYRRGSKVDRSNAPLHNVPIEVAWTAIPLAIAMAIFASTAVMFFQIKTVPPGAMEIYVTGKQWMWKVQHPEGRWENNTLHVPLGRKILLTMTSEDVIHSFYVPAFRLKMDAIPGEYTKMWFEATKAGTFPLYCAEFCGTLHSQMIGTVTVMEPAAYEKWLREGDVSTSLAAEGQRLFIQHGCDGCHGPKASVRAPSLEGIYGKPIPVQIPADGTPPDRLAEVVKTLPAQTVIADDTYIHDSIVLPNKWIAAGYPPIMPTFKNRLSEAEILRIVAYIKSMGALSGANQGRVREATTQTLTADEYRARVGFVPENVPTNGTAAQGQQGAAAAGGRQGSPNQR